MKTVQSVVIVTLCLTFVSCDVPGALIGFSGFASRVAPTCANSFTPICGDCQTLWKCQNTDIPPPPTVDCKTAYPDKPYCSNGVCTSEPAGECVSEFRCTGAGYYPNPLNCSRYHLCGAAGAVGTAAGTYECPPDFVYNPATTMCKKSVAATDCAVIDCSADPYGYIAYPADQSFFASCTPNEEPLLLRCPPNNVYDPATFTCVFQCPREGRIADQSDKTKFYECYFNGSIYFSQSLKCVDGYEFNASTQQCFNPLPAVG